MAEPSSAWTPAERLAVIQACVVQLMRAMDKPLLLEPGTPWCCAEAIEWLAVRDAGFLEENRIEILAWIQREEEA